MAIMSLILEIIYLEKKVVLEKCHKYLCAIYIWSGLQSWNLQKWMLCTVLLKTVCVDEHTGVKNYVQIKWHFDYGLWNAHIFNTNFCT